MKVVISKDKATLARDAANVILDLVRRQPNAVLGLPTGATVLPLYKELIRACRAGRVSLAQVRTFAVAEYVDSEHRSTRRCRHFMNVNLFDHVDIPAGNILFPDLSTPDPTNAGLEYERRIEEAGGIDLQVLGLGSNGRIGLNEPTSSLASRTRVKTLSRSTIRDDSRRQEPGKLQSYLALTMGVATILEARQILLLANGTHKADAVKAAVEGALTAMCPASALQLHPRVSVMIDPEAASKLKLADYYRWAYGTNIEEKTKGKKKLERADEMPSFCDH